MLDRLPATRRAILVAVQLPDTSDEELVESLAELGRLAQTLGLQVVGQMSQKRRSFDPSAYIGSGKFEELKNRCEADEFELIVVDHEISPSQTRHLEKETGAEVMDRTGLILEIFQRHASSKAAKAQVEIVRLKYLAPRLRETKGRLDRVRGGIGGKGAGETKHELDRRRIRDRIAELEKEIETMDGERAQQRARRKDLNRVALVGYTNAGKSTLMRALTGSEVYVADKLFATLDTTVRTLTPETQPKVLVSDTVGFIKKLPHGLVASFKSTLDEALEASILVHVVDASDPGFEGQLEVTHEVLAEIGAGEIPRMIVMNKIDRVGDAEAQATVAAQLHARWPDAMVLSALRPADVSRLHAALVAFFDAEMQEAVLEVPYDRQDLRGPIFESCQVLGEEYEEGSVHFKVRARTQDLSRLRQLLGHAPPAPVEDDW